MTASCSFASSASRRSAARPEELQAHLDRERAKWGPIIKEANISLQ